LDLVGPEDMVEEFLLPNRAFAIEQSVDPPCGWTFDGIYNLGRGVGGVGRALLAANRRVDQVHVGGHNKRRMQLVFVAVLFQAAVENNVSGC
jgi:hypothetical protein